MIFYTTVDIWRSLLQIIFSQSATESSLKLNSGVVAKIHSKTQSPLLHLKISNKRKQMMISGKETIKKIKMSKVSKIKREKRNTIDDIAKK